MKPELDNNMKIVKLVVLYFVKLVLLEKDNRNYINETNVLLVDNFNEFNEYPWGCISFKMTIDSLRKGVADHVAKHKEKSNTACKYKEATYSVHGFPHAFLITKLN